MRYTLIFIFLVVCINSFSQTPGLIVKPATGAGATVLDVNGDGYTSETNLGFINNDYEVTENEIDFTDLVRPDPIGDPLSGPNGSFNEIVGTNDDGEHAIFTYLDGTNFIVRFRLDSYAKNSKAYSLLIDTDEKFGFTGPDADPNAVPGNPGFEIEIALYTNFRVVVCDVDGNADGESNILNGWTRPYDEYCQKSVAMSMNSGDADFFYTFFVPFSDLLLAQPGLTTSTPMRYAAVTSMNPHASIGNNAISDVSGDTGSGSIDDIFEELIESQTPTVPGAEVLTRSDCPSINTPISSGSTSVSGTSSEANGTVIEVFVNDVSIGTTTVTSGAWSLSSIGPFAGGEAIKATATAPGEGTSKSICNITFVGSDCAVIPNVSTISNGDKGVRILNVTDYVAGTILTVYTSAGTEWVGSKADNNPYIITGSEGATVDIGCGGQGNCMVDGSFYVIADPPSACASLPAYFCVGATTATSAPAIDAISPLSSYVTGTGGVSGATMYIYADGSVIGYKTLTTSGAWSVAVDPYLICNTTLTAKQVSAGSCISVVSNSVIIGEAVTSAPTINSFGCSSSISVISGYSSEDNGTSIEVFVNSVSVGTTTVSSGTWSISASAVTNDVITATATNSANCKSVSVLSSSVTLNGTTILTGSFSIDTPVYSGDASVPVTVSGTSGTYTLNLYIDGDLIGSQSFSSNGIVNVGITYTGDLYTGGELTVSLTQGSQCESSQTSVLETVQCSIPTFVGRAISLPETNKCVTTTGTIQITNSESLVIYTPVSVTGDTVKGYSALGNGGTISLTTYPFSAEGIERFYIKAEKLVPSGTCDSVSTSYVQFNAFTNPLVTTQPTDQSLCSGDATTIYAEWAGTGPYNVQWQYNNGGGFMNLSDGGVYSQTTISGTTSTNATLIISDVSMLDAYSYQAVITDLGVPSECQSTISDASTFTVDYVYISNSTITNDTDPDFEIGAIDITVSGGVTPYSYDWHHIDGTGDFDDSEDLVGLPEGTYTVTIRDANLCTYEESFYVAGLGSISLAKIYETDISCYGANDGEFKVRASTGTPPYKFSIDNFVTFQTDSVFSNLTPGLYTVVARDALNAQSNSVSITIDEPIEMVVYSSKSNPSISLGDGLINITVIGGTTPLDYELYQVGAPDVLVGQVTSSTSRDESFSSLSNGTYYVVLTDANGCTATKTGITLTNPTVVSNPCVYVASHSFNAASGQDNYSGYDGSYNFFSTSWAEATDVAEIAIDNDALAFGRIPSSSNSTNTWASARSITRQIDLLGATNIVLSYKVQTSQSSNQDDYYVYVYVNRTTYPTAVASYYITNSGDYATQSTITFSSLSNWLTSSGNSSNTITIELSAGQARSNFRIDDFTLTYNKNMNVGSVTSSATCDNGSIDLSVTGGYSPYTYDWNTDGTGDFDDSKDLSGLSATTYNIIVQDSRGCSTSSTGVTVSSSPLTASISGSNPTCAGGGSNGTVTATITATGNGGPYTYKLIKGATDTIATAVSGLTSKTFTGLDAGTYSVKIWQDADGCNTQTSSTVLTIPSVSSTLAATGSTNLCYGSTTTVAVTVSGGTGPYAVSLSNGQLITNYTSGNNITISPTPSASTTITVTSVTDANSCVSASNTGSVAITIYSLPTAAVSGGGSACSGETTDVTIDFTGTAPFTFTYAINGVDQTPIITSSDPYTLATGTSGTYTVTALSDAYCTGSSFTGSAIVTVVSKPSLVVSSIGDASCAADPDGFINITASGGASGYSFVWAGGTLNGSTNEDQTNVDAGVYGVQVTDANGCTTVLSPINVNYNDQEDPVFTSCPANVSITTNGVNCVGNLNPTEPVAIDNCGTVTLTWEMVQPVSGTTTGSNSIGNTTFDEGVTTITYTATDGNSNTATCSFTVTVADNTDPTPLCQNVTIAVDINGDATLLASQVDNGSSDDCTVTPTLEISKDATNYYNSVSYNCSELGSGNTITLRVSDGGGNSATCTATITVEDNQTATTSLAVSDASVCNPATGNTTITITGSENGVRYELKTLGGASLSPIVTATGDGNDIDLTILQANLPSTTTTYKVVATAGCTDFDLTDQPVITVYDQPSVNTQPSNSTICSNDNTSFSVDVNNTDTYQWQVSSNGGSSWSNVSNDATYGGATTNTLTLTNIPLSLNNYQYKCILSSVYCNDVETNSATLTVNSCGISVSGYTFNDQAGMGDNYVGIAPPGPQSAISSLDGNQLYAILVDQTAGADTVLQSIAISSGSYSFSSIDLDLNLQIIITITNYSAGASSPVTSLPSQWEYTGEKQNDATNSLQGNDGTVDGIFNLGVTNTDQQYINFGIRKNFAPVANDDNTSGNMDTDIIINVTTNDTDTENALDVSSVDLDTSTSGQQTSVSDSWGTWSVDASGILTFHSATDVCGTASIMYTIQDLFGNTSNEATVTIDLTDNIPPTVTSCPTDINSCTQTLDPTDPVFDDNCGVTKVTWTMTGDITDNSPATGLNYVGSYSFPFGTTTITYTAFDAEDNSIATCSFDVNVYTTPVITNPGNQTSCGDYTLPAITGTNLTGTEAYYTITNGGGIQFDAGEKITLSPTTLYIYDNNNGCSDEESFVITINRLNIQVIDVTGSSSPTTSDGSDNNSGSHCPDLVSPDFNADNINYDPGITEVLFRIDRQYSSTSWQFDYAITGTNVDIDTVTISSDGSTTSLTPDTLGQYQSGNIDASNDNAYILLTVSLINIPGTQLNPQIQISNVSDENCFETEGSGDNNITHQIEIMPVVGTFN